MQDASVAIDIRSLTKVYSNGKGIYQIDLQVRQGEIFGFLGPNGAGKSTTIRTLMGLLTPSQGTATVLGHDIVQDGVAVRAKVGYLPSEITLYQELSTLENIKFALAARGLSDLAHAQALADELEVDLRRKIRTLSRGQRQKAAIVAALAHKPEVLILDEPTTGLDPLVQERFYRILTRERDMGHTVFMSSHILHEVEALCGRIAIIRDGRIVAIDTVANMKRVRLKRVTVEWDGPVPDLRAMAWVQDFRQDGGTTRFVLKGSPHEMLAELSKGRVIDIRVEDPPLEEIFRAFYS